MNKLAMDSLIDVTDLTEKQINALIQRALLLKQMKTYPSYPNINVLNLFYEDSTRTRLSFELAAKRLGLTVLNLDPKRSSETKGELLSDTLETVAAMGVDIVVIRHTDDAIFEQIKNNLHATLHLINAGCGMLAHPTQALLDIMTMLEAKVDLKAAKITVVGDILHSRVAGSLQRLCAILGVHRLVFTGPRLCLPEQVAYGEVTDDFDDALSDADVVIALRIQRERFDIDKHIDFDRYKLTEIALKYAKKNACIMHPGPINRGVEIDSAVADGPQSYILKQVENGVFLRMAVLEGLLAQSLV
jgi:aspartate carbamoyltransferase catalytic subunit